MTTPTVCTLQPFHYLSVSQPEGSLGASSNRLNEQQLENFLRRLLAAVCADLQNASGAQRFLELLDAPHSYLGQAHKFVRVNSIEDALEFVTLPTGVQRFIELLDVPASYVAQALKGVRVNAAATGLEFFVRALLGLADFPAAFTGAALKYLRVNAGENAVEFQTFPTLVTAFTQLSDVPNSYAGHANDLVRVNAAAGALEFVTSPTGTAFTSQMDWRVSVTEANAGIGSVQIGYQGGPLFTGTGTATFPTVASTNVHTSQGGRIRNTSGTGNSALAEWHSTTDFCWRGNAAGRGGFSFFYRFGNAATPATNFKCFFGLIVSAAAAPIGSVDPSSFLNCIGVGCDGADTNLSFFNNDGSGTATKTSLGSSFPARTTDTLYDIVIVAAPNGGNVTYSVTNLGTGAVATGTISSDLPSTTTFLGWITWTSNGGSASSVQAIFDFTRLTINYNP